MQMKILLEFSLAEQELCVQIHVGPQDRAEFLQANMPPYHLTRANFHLSRFIEKAPGWVSQLAWPGLARRSPVAAA